MKCLLAAIAVLSVGCDMSPTPETKAAPAAVAPKPVPSSAGKQVITITTKSPAARAAFLKSWELSDNGRYEEALGECKVAVAADPDFALAHTCIGNLTPGAAAQAELDTGSRLAAKLPDAERLFAEAFAAQRRQEMDKYYADIRRMAELAPDDFHGQLLLGSAYLDQRDFAAAEAAFKKALALNPAASFIHGSLATVDTQLGRYEDAVAAAKEYVEGAPAEAGAHQALADALLNLNQTKAADAELAKAVALAPKAGSPLYDLALVKAIEGDFTGARDVLSRAKATEAQPTDALERANDGAWLLFGEGKQGEALAQLAFTEKDADAAKLPWPAQEASTRAWALWVIGKPAEALKAAEAGLARCDSRPESSALYKGSCHRDLLQAKAFILIQEGKVVEAEKTLAELREQAKQVPDNHWLQLTVEMLADQIAGMKAKDAKAVAALFAKCPPDDIWWKLSILRQAEKAGDKALAEQVRKDLLGRPIKDFGYPAIAAAAKK